nr:hypothetical protein CFP56_77799 [Quercus suber]
MALLLQAFLMVHTLSTKPCHVMLSLRNNLPSLKNNTKLQAGTRGYGYPFLSQPWMCRQCFSQRPIHLANYLIPNPQNNQPQVVEIIKLTPTKGKPFCILGQQIYLGTHESTKPRC